MKIKRYFLISIGIERNINSWLKCDGRGSLYMDDTQDIDSDTTTGQSKLWKEQAENKDR